MNKALILTGVGTGGTVIATSGVYVSGAFGGSNNKGSNNIKTLNLQIPDNLDELKKKEEEDQLVQDHFEDIDGSDKGQKWDGSSSFIFVLSGGGEPDVTSKLTVNWEKYGCEGAEGKGSGKIQGLWSIVHRNDGIIFYAEAKSSTSEDGKLDVKGNVYVIEKGDKNGKIKYNKESEIKSPISDGGNHLPKVGSKFKNDLEVKDYGGFIDNSNQLTSLCKSSLPEEKTPTSKFMGSWTGKYETPQKLANIPEQRILVGNEGGVTGLNKFYGTEMMNKLKNGLDVTLVGPGSEGNFENKSLGVNNSN